MTEERATDKIHSIDEAGRPLRLLVVDDDALGRNLMGIMLTPGGYELEYACDGVEALEALKTRQYDLVFMDLVLPDMNGREVCRAFREWEAGRQRTPVVAVTAFDLPGQPAELVRAGMDDYVFKPYDLRGLTRIIRLYASGDEQGAANETGAGNRIQRPEAPVLDLRSSLEDFSNDIASFQELLRDFVEALPVRLDKMRQARDAGDFERLDRECHSLKGISAGLGAMRLSQLAGQLDHSVRDGERASISEALRHIEQSMAEVRSEAMHYLASSPA